MKTKLTRLYSVFWACLAGYLLLSFSSNPPNGRTGSPPTFNTCASAAGGCHSGGAFNGSVSITGLPGTITPSTTYQITVTLTQPTPFAEFGGFQMNVLDNNNSNFGTLSNPGPSSTVQSNFFEHNPAQIFTGTTITYTCDWTSPASGNTTVTMYAAALFANGNGGTSGDQTVTTTASGVMMAGGQILVNVTGTNVSCFGGSNGTATAVAMGGGGGPYTYNWSNGMSGSTITNLTAGTYFVTATNAGGTPGTGSITITEPGAALLATITATENISCADPTGSATAEGAGGTPGYSYLWSNGTSGPTINVTTGGNYTVTVTDNNQCTATAIATIEEDNVIPIADAGPAATINCSNPTVLLDGTSSSSGASITYQWTTTDGNIVSGANTTTPLVDAGGTYTLTVTDVGNGCTATDNTTVNANTTPPAVSIAPPGLLDCASSSIVLDGSASSSGADISYLWTTSNGNIVSGATTNMATVDAAGTYTLTVTNNATGCSASSTAAVLSDTTPPVADAGDDQSLDCNHATVVLNGSASSAGANISYLWTTSDGNITAGETTTMPTVDAAGTYTLTVTNNSNSCTASDSVLVTQTPALTASISSQTNVDCNGNANGNATASGTGGNGNYSFSWSNGQTGQTIASVAAGTYTVTITDTDNCTATASATITEPPALLVEVTTTDESSPGTGNGSATANPSGGTPGYTYSWNTSDTTQTITGLSSGTYTVTVTDENGCTQSASGTVNSFDCSNFSATISTTGATCSGGSDGSATITPNNGVAPFSYLWSDGQTTQTASGLSAGVYSVTLTEATGCEKVLMANVTEPAAVLVSLNNTTQPACNGGMDGTITVSATGGSAGFTFLWSNGGMGDTLANLAAGTYTVTATDLSNCTDSLTITLGEPSALTLNGVQVENVLCQGDSTGSATVNAAGGTPDYTYAWPNGQAGPTQSNLAAGSYEITTTDANGCTATLAVIITEPAALLPNATATDETAPSAQDGTATASPGGGTGNYAIEWDNGDTTATITNLAPGTYCVTVTDGNDCTASACVVVNAFVCAGVSTSTDGTGISCFGNNDGEASVTATGFAEPVTYLWSNDSTSATISGLSPGMYSVTVTGADGCSGTDQYEVVSPAELTISTTAVTNAECPDVANGSVTVTGNGGTPDYTYTWSDGTTGATNDSLMMGNYEVTVADENGCTAALQVAVAVDPDTELPNVILQDITVELDTNGMASITAGMIDNGSTDNCGIDTIIIDISTFTCDDLGKNTVVAAVADFANNCAAGMATVTVVDNLAPTITCPDNITIQSNNCEEMVDYAPPVADDNCGAPAITLIEGLPAGSTFSSGLTVVTYEAMDLAGNTTTCSFSVTINNGFSATAVPTSNARCNGSEDGEAVAAPSGGLFPYTYLWNDASNQTTQTATGLGTGSYTVTVTDAAGCETTATAIVTEPAPLVLSIDSVTNETGNNMDGAIEVTISGGTSGYTFEWTLNGNLISTEEDPTGLAAGDYTVLIIDANECILESTITVSMVNSTLNPALGRFIKLFPNPVTDQLFLQFDLPHRTEVSISIFDMNGQLVLSGIRDSFSKKSITLELNDVVAGMYVVRMVLNDEVVIRRFVVGE